MTTGKTIALTIWTFVSNVISLLFNMVSWFVITFLPSSKRLLISWLQSLPAMVLEPKRIKSATVWHTHNPFLYIYLQLQVCNFPGGARGKEPTCWCRRHRRCRFTPWVGKIPWRRAWQPTPVLLPRESPMGRGAWWATVHRVTKSQMWLKWLSTAHNHVAPLRRKGALSPDYPRIEWHK